MRGGTSSESSDNEAEKLLQLPDKLSSTHLRDKNSDPKKLPQPPSRHSAVKQSCSSHQQQLFQPQQHQERDFHTDITPVSSSTIQLTVPLTLSTCQTSSAMSSSTSMGSMPTTTTTPIHYTVEEETTAVKIPMLRPRPGLLRVLHLSGAVGETFTMGEIIRHVKEYITERRLYDEQDPRIVYCGGDLLGEALGVDQFTINEVLGLFRQNCILEPDSCIRIRRHLVTRPVSTSHAPAARCEASVYTTAGQSSRTQPTTVIPTSSSTLPPEGLQQKCSADSTNQQPEIASTSSQCGTVNHSAAKSSVTVTDSDLERCQGEQVVTSTDSSSDADYQRNSRVKSRRHGADHNTSSNRRHRSTSINVSYDEPDGATGPWACEVRVETDPGETAQPEDDTVVVEYESDTFSVEYDVESGSDVEQQGTNPADIHEGEQTNSESDISSSTSGAAILVVCKESDVEYLADYSDSDNGSDAELSDADKWDCNYCNVKNPPFQRNCGGCWSVRPDWLPSSGKSVESDVKTESQSEITETTTVSEEASCSQITSQESAILSQISSQGLEEANKETHNTNVSEVTGAAKKRKYSSCLSTSDSQEDKIKDSQDKQEEEQTELLSDEQKKKTRKKHSVNPFLDKSDACVVCLSRKKTASIIHGKTGHQVCCYRCAKRLKKQRKSCPICRRPIQKVIRNFHL